MVLIPEKSSLIDPTQDKMAVLAILWPNLAKYGFNYNFGQGCNFTSQFYIKRVTITEKAVLLTPLKTKWSFLATLWPNLAKHGFNYNFGQG